MKDQTNEATRHKPPATPTAYQLASAIAAHLTDTARWSARRRSTPDGEDIPKAAELVRDDGAAIGLWIGGYREEGRVAFRPIWPKYRDDVTYAPRTYPKIRCNAQRPASALAREFERRLLADYDSAYQAALETIRASNAAAEQVWQSAERISRAIGAEMPSKERRERQHNGAALELHADLPSLRRLRVHPGYADVPLTVSFELHDLDEQTALLVLTALTSGAT